MKNKTEKNKNNNREYNKDMVNKLMLLEIYFIFHQVFFLFFLVYSFPLFSSCYFFLFSSQISFFPPNSLTSSLFHSSFHLFIFLFPSLQILSGFIFIPFFSFSSFFFHLLFLFLFVVFPFLPY